LDEITASRQPEKGADMAKAFASTIINAPIEAVWHAVRDFNALPSWVPVIARSEIEDGLDPDVVGCVRSLYLQDGTHVRERLLELDDSRCLFSYNFERPAFPVSDYVATFVLMPVTNGDRTFAQWSATFEEAPGERGKYEAIISRDVFAAGFESLASKAAGRAAPEGAQRWQGWRPAKVFCSSVINAPVEGVWARVRDFAGMADWHPAISRMVMQGGVRSDKVSAVRDFTMNGGDLLERLTYLSDREHAFRYTIEKSPFPLLNYHAGARFYPITSSDRTFAVWTADWIASANDDVNLIPSVHNEVFQKAFDTLNTKFFSGG
jgi:uncharacterized protein YndB with AHSA1/START domain